MPFEDSLTGLPRPDTEDWVSSIPRTEREFVRRLAKMLRRPFASENERDTTFGRLGLNDAAVAPIPSQNIEARWDGRQWVTHDTRPKEWNPGWFSGSELAPLSNTTGTCTGTYLRRGHTVWWRIVFVRGAGANVGSGYYSWELPFALDTYNSSGSGFVRNGAGGSMELDGSVVMRDSKHVSLLSGAKRIGTDSFETIADGMTIVLTGEGLIGGLQ